MEALLVQSLGKKQPQKYTYAFKSTLNVEGSSPPAEILHQ